MAREHQKTSHKEVQTRLSLAFCTGSRVRIFNYEANGCEAAAILSVMVAVCERGEMGDVMGCGE